MKKIVFIVAMIMNIVLLGQAPNCTGDYFLSVALGEVYGFYKIQISPLDNDITFNSLGTSNTNIFVNSVGFRSTDNFIYGLTKDNELCRINALGEVTVLTIVTGLDPDFGYFAGDVSPDGQYLFLLGTGGSQNSTSVLARINLDDYSTESANLPLPPGTALSISDLVFDPETNDVYAFDGNANRLLKLNSNTGSIDENLYPSTDAADAMAAIFIDAFGDLYGYGRQPSDDLSNTFFKINKTTGEITPTATGPSADQVDACSCPYSVEIQKSVFPKVALPCDEVTYVFKIANGSAFSQTGLNFLDEMPDDLIITEIIRNPFNGNLVSGVGTNILSIENFTLPQGVDSLIVRAYVSETANGVYKNQASISNLSEGLGNESLSDDPSTIATEDSTTLLVATLSATINNLNTQLCPGDTLLLQAMDFPTATYKWSTGSSESSTQVTATGWYFVEVTSQCNTQVDSVYVSPTDFEIDIQPSFMVELGDSILLPLVYNSNPIFAWNDPFGNSLSCLNCPQPHARPFFDTNYIISATDPFGCTLRKQVEVKVIKDRKIYIPNAFSPNFDGINDIFYIQGKGYGQIRNFSIFNRWGALIFEHKDGWINTYSDGWDGRFKGATMNPQTFVYFADIEFLDGIIVRYQGDVLLLR